MIINEQISNFVKNEKVEGPIKNPRYKGIYKNENIYTKALFQGYGDTRRVLHGIGKKVPDGIKLEIFKNIAKYVEDFFEGKNIINTQIDYDNWHNDICNKIMVLFEEHGYPINYGNAQKIVNMGFKYLRCYCVGTSPIEIEKFRYCHCPIDTVICNSIINCPCFTLTTEEKNVLNAVFKGKTPWSKLDYEEYMRIQKIISKVVSQMKVVSSSFNWGAFEAYVGASKDCSNSLYFKVYVLAGLSNLDLDILLWKK